MARTSEWPDTRWTPAEVAEGLGVPVSAVWDWIALKQLSTLHGAITDYSLHNFLWRFPLAGRSRTRNRAWVDGLLWDHDLFCKEYPDVKVTRRAAQAVRRGQAAPEVRAA